MVRLIVFILIFAVFLAFIVLNLENRSDVSLGFITYYDAPVFLTVLVSFALGIVVAISTVLSMGGKRKKPPEEHTPKIVDPVPSKKALEIQDKIKKEESPYGID